MLPELFVGGLKVGAVEGEIRQGEAAVFHAPSPPDEA
jgi:hypothetical protein